MWQAVLGAGACTAPTPTLCTTAAHAWPTRHQIAPGAAVTRPIYFPHRPDSPATCGQASCWRLVVHVHACGCGQGGQARNGGGRGAAAYRAAGESGVRGPGSGEHASARLGGRIRASRDTRTVFRTLSTVRHAVACGWVRIV